MNKKLQAVDFDPGYQYTYIPYWREKLSLNGAHPLPSKRLYNFQSLKT